MAIPSFSMLPNTRIAFGVDRVDKLGGDVAAVAGKEASLLLVADPGLPAIAERVEGILKKAGHRVATFTDVRSDPLGFVWCVPVIAAVEPALTEIVTTTSRPAIVDEPDADDVMLFRLPFPGAYDVYAAPFQNETEPLGAGADGAAVVALPAWDVVESWYPETLTR